MDPIEAALRSVAGDMAPPASPSVRPNSGNPSRTPGGAPDLSGVVDRIAQVEGTGQNPRSSSRGVGQFTDATLLGTYRRHYPQGGLSDAQVLALKDDPQAMQTMLGHLVQDNAGALTASGHDATPGHVYLANYFGAGGAHAILSADPATPVAQIVGDKVMRANPQLAGMSAGDVAAMTDARMGGGGAQPATPSMRSDPNDPIEAALTAFVHGDAEAASPMAAGNAPASPAYQGGGGGGAQPQPGQPRESWGQFVGHGLNDAGVGVVRGVTDVGGTIGTGIDKLGHLTGLWNSDLQGQADRSQADLARSQYDPDGWGSTLGRLGGEMFATAPVAEMNVAKALGATGKLAGVARLGTMAAQGGIAGALSSGGHDIGAAGVIGAAASPALGLAAEKIALPAALRAYGAAKGIGAKAVDSDMVKGLRAMLSKDEVPAIADGAASAMPEGWSAADYAQGWRHGAGGQVEFAPPKTIRRGDGPDMATIGPDGRLRVDIVGGARAEGAPASTSSIATDAVRDALGSRGSKAGLEGTTDLPPAIAEHIQRLQAEGVPLDHAIREADITFAGGKPTIATVTRDAGHQAAVNEGAKLLTPEGRALNARNVSNNAAVTSAMQGLVQRYGGVPTQGEAAETAARALAAASDAERANVSRLYRIADDDAVQAKQTSDLKTIAAQRDADHAAGAAAQQQARSELDAAQQALREARALPGTTGAANVDKARTNMTAARAKLRQVTDNPPKAATVMPSAGDGYIDLSSLRDALDAPELASPTIEGGKTLRSGTLGLMDAYGKGGNMVTLDQAERIRQAIGNAYDPMGGGINHHIGRLKGVLDDALDSTDAGPSFKAARAAHKAWAERYDDPAGIAQLIRRDGKGNFVNADNWRQAENHLTGGISDRHHAQVVRQLQAIGATQSLDRIKAAMLQKAYQAASKGAQDAGGNAVASGTRWFETLNGVGLPKLQATFSPDELAEVAAIGRAASHLHEPVPGTNNSSNTSSASANGALAQRMIEGIAAAQGKKTPGPGVHVATTAGGAVATALGHTVLGPAASVAISGGKLVADAVSRRAVAQATKAGLMDAMDPARARLAAAIRVQRQASAAKRQELSRALSAHVGRGAGAVAGSRHSAVPQRQQMLADGVRRAALRS